MMSIGLSHFLILSTILFGLGIFVISTRRNVIAILMGIELVLNAANINFVAFSRYLHGNIDGHIFSIFVIILAAAEAVVGMAIVLMLFRRYKHVDAVNLDNLKQ